MKYIITIILSFVIVQCQLVSNQVVLNYDISVALKPSLRSLSSTTIITFNSTVPKKIEFRLLKSLKIVSITALGFDFDENTNDQNYRSITFTQQNEAEKFKIVFNFDGEVFNLPKETNLNQRHSNSLGIISDKSKEGIYLPAGSFYPYPVGDFVANFDIEVMIDKDYSVVLSGNKIEESSFENKIISKWATPFPVDEVTIVGGKFQKYTRDYDNHHFNLLTYEATNLADKYLDAIIEHYKIYTELFGDYPFNEFSIVENFFATGFGMPGYTLLSGKLLAMPFVALSPGSLAHEFVHNWWGNSVYVDYEKGNWCEALTTFSSNYYYNVYKNKQNEQIDWRKKALLAIDDLPADRNYPVIKFRYQQDMMDAVVGYSKGAFIFYEVYKLIGKQNFFDALRDLAKEFRGKRAYWNDIINLFDKYTPQNIKKDYNIRNIVSDWLNSTDIPLVEIVGDKSKVENDKLVLHISKSTNLVTTIALNINRNGIWEEKFVTLKDNLTKIYLDNPTEIDEIILDRDFHSLRKMFKWEKSFTFNRVLSDNPLIVAPSEQSPNYAIAKKFYDEMIESGYRCSFITSDKFDERDIRDKSIIAIGNLNENKAIRMLQVNLPKELALNNDEVSYNQGKIATSESILMANIQHPYNSAKNACIINFDKLSSFDPLRRLFHYQSYSLALLDINKPGKPIYSIEIFPNIYDKKQQALKIQK